MKLKYWVLLILYCGVLWGDPTFNAINSLPAELEGELLGQIPSFLAKRIEKLAFDSIRFRSLRDQKIRLVLPGSRTLRVVGMPELPVVVRKLVVPAGMRVEVSLGNLKLEESETAVALPIVSEPYVWGEASVDMGGDSLSGRYFPGKLVKVRQVNSIAYVSLFPVQYDRETGRLLKVSAAELRVNFREEVSVSSPMSLLLSWDSAEALIVTTEELADAALLLKHFHKIHFDVKSEIVTLESIAQFQSPIEEEKLPAGYKDGLGEGKVQRYDPETGDGYNYLLARKLMQYLRARMHPESPTKYVVLLGDATAIPPSYYFENPMGLGVTDQCYANKNRCMEPQLSVGRLPFGHVKELNNYLQKLLQWMEFARKAKRELSLFGGKAFPMAPVYVGELGTLSVLSRPNTDWSGVEKYFRTKGNYKKLAVEQLFSGEAKAPFSYIIDHGGGNRLAIESEGITSREIMELPASPKKHFPMVVSVACTNAAFDQPLMEEDIFKKEEFGEHSIGEALLLSQAGAVAYLGSARPAIGMPSFTVDNSGNLEITGSTHMLQLLDTILENYRAAGKGKLGDIVLKGLKDYVFESGNDPEEDRHRWTYLGFTLLGDPVVVLPNREKLAENHGLAKVEMLMTVGFPFPRLLLEELAGNIVGILSHTEVETSLLEVPPPYSADPEKLVHQTTASGEFELTLPELTSYENRYLLRLENQKGVPLERRVWFETAQDPSSVVP